ncbi:MULTISPECIES: PH domain-containing protein [unclassified Microbispora]|uniref:PH domain-containing protein n=1 Tax=unclassified Microbispora TaxID=2614687 RepID=UPI001473DD0D|nr:MULTISPECIES: PH domain-containing protein [unclassified Microbispora]
MKPQVYRSRLAWICGWAWMLFAAWNVWDLVAHGSIPSALIAGAVLGVITALVFVMALRPAIVAEEGGVRVRNVLRNAYVPWSGVDDVSVASAIVIESGGTTVRCWTPQATARERARAAGRAAKAAKSANRAERAAAEAVGARTHADWVAAQLTEMSRSRRENSSGETRVTWSPSALAAVAAALALVAAAFVVS